MRSRGAIAAGALIGAVLVVMAASSGTRAGGLESDLGVRSVLASIVLTLGGLFLLTVVGFFWTSLLTRSQGEDGERTRTKAPLAVKVALLCFLVGVMALFYFLFLHGAHPRRPPSARLGGGAPTKQPPAGKPLPFNAAASSSTVAVVLVLAGLVLFRHRLVGLFRQPRPFNHFEPSSMAPLHTTAVEPVGPAPLPDPFRAGDPRQAVILSYQRFALLMGERGYSRRQQETPFEYERRLAGSGPITEEPDRLATMALTELFSAARYGRGPVSEETRARALGALAALESRLAGT
jgi:hypothetical protein